MPAPSKDAYIGIVALVVENADFQKIEAAPTLNGYLEHQGTGALCKQAVINVDQTNANFTIDKKRMIIRVTLVNAIVQILVPKAFQGLLFYDSLYFVIGDHSKQWRI